ncbi:hypothetical protein [Serinicoccus kebangsaanensis]|uniref:hypothetical protein n=1 Tax=Serinicoccus kebangsaanensis TaxID=2602069 RepID=UPI00124DBB30|nr:hypothetical protein [Serinicoccus kebangsaanensis]
MGRGRATPQDTPWWPTGVDGRLQVGVGPGAWSVDGWVRPDRPEDVGWQFIRRLGADVVGPQPERRSLEVRGEGQLAEALRAAVWSTQGRGGAAAASPARGRTADHPRRVVLVRDHLVPVGTAGRPDVVGRRVLPVVAQTARVVIGPWTGLPGGPCLHCLDLHRRDRDPGWPQVAQSLVDPATAPLPPRHQPEVVHAVVSLIVLMTGSAAGPAVGVAHEVGPRPPHLVTRRWPAHPGCPWHEPGTAG